LNELALFAGAGGGILGGQLLGWRTVCAVEWEPYAACVLAARQNDGLLPSFPIWDDVQTFDGRPWRGVAQVISGGFPCQDISIAGKGDGLDGERSGMWRQMARIICEVGPEYVYVENSPMLVSRGLGAVLGDLSSMGFDAKWGIVGAKDVGANHQRDRIWIVAHSNSNGWTTRKKSRSLGTTISEQQEGQDNPLHSEGASSLPATEGDVSDSSQLFSNGINDNSRVSMGRKEESQLGNNSGQENVSDSECLGWEEGSNECGVDGKKDSSSISGECGSATGEGEVSDSMLNRLQGSRTDGATKRQVGLRSRKGRNEEQNFYASDSAWWAAEPDLGRVAHGVDARVDRLKAIGNGQVPLCAATAWRILK
jgi:DNA (cytosine-5)-methyltransferase 1